MVLSALKYLGPFIETKRDVLEPSVSAKKNFKNVIMLNYYRNNLIHVFIHDAEIASAIFGLSQLHDISKGVSIQQVWEKFQYLQNLLSEEFVVKKTIKNLD